VAEPDEQARRLREENLRLRRDNLKLRRAIRELIDDETLYGPDDEERDAAASGVAL
jgi:hypothetical protein